MAQTGWKPMVAMMFHRHPAAAPLLHPLPARPRRRGSHQGTSPVASKSARPEILKNFAGTPGPKVGHFPARKHARHGTRRRGGARAGRLRCRPESTAAFTKPIDAGTTGFFGSAADLVVTIEDHVIMGGYGSAVLELFREKLITTPVVRIGWPDKFIEHATTVEDLRQKYGLTVENLLSKVRAALGTGTEAANRAAPRALAFLDPEPEPFYQPHNTHHALPRCHPAPRAGRFRSRTESSPYRPTRCFPSSGRRHGARHLGRQRRVFDAAVAKAYVAAARSLGSRCLPARRQEQIRQLAARPTPSGVPGVPGRHQGTAHHPGRRWDPVAERALRQMLDPLCLPPPGPVFHRRPLPRQAAGEGRDGDFPREHRGHSTPALITKPAAPRRSSSSNSSAPSSPPLQEIRFGKEAINEIGLGVKPVSRPERNAWSAPPIEYASASSARASRSSTRATS